MNDIANAQNNMGVELEYCYSLRPINKKLLYFHTIIKNKIVIVSINKKTNNPTLFK
jgi:hypothetical protein